MKSSFKDQVIKTINRYKMIEGHSSVLVGLSGGADSVALVHVLKQLEADLQLKFSCAHINHGLRGGESDEEAVFCEEFCNELGIPFKEFKVDVKGYSEENSVSIEVAARHLRYGIFSETATGLIATAHTASDNLETVILNITRGCGIKGISGIPPVRDNIIRPLIDVTREQVEDYCMEQGLSYVTDSSNLLDEYSRNKIRHHVVPILKSINSGAEFNALRLSNIARDQSKFISLLADKFLDKNSNDDGVDINALREADTGLRSAVITQFVTKSALNCDQKKVGIIEQLITDGSGSVDIDSIHFACVKKDRLNVCEKCKKTTKVKSDYVTVSRFPFKYNNITLLISSSLNKINNLDTKSTLDYDKIIGSMVCRTRKIGDEIKLSGRPTKKLKKLFIESKIPLEMRDQLVVISDGKGVVYVESFGASERVMIDNDTKKIIKIRRGITN